MLDRVSPIHRLYIITNSMNGKQYVGQTSQHFLSGRWSKHLACARKGIDTYLYRAIRKYGVDKFSIKEIARCTDKEGLLRLEKNWIALIRSNDRQFGYNQTSGGEAPKHTEETRRKISEKQKGKRHSEGTKHKIGLAHLGMKRSLETGLKISLSKLGKKRPHLSWSSAGLQRIAEARKRRWSDPEEHRKLSERLKLQWQDSEYRKKMIKSVSNQPVENTEMLKPVAYFRSTR